MDALCRKQDDGLLAGNQDTSLLKVMALCLMLIDHVGIVLFQNMLEFRVIGRMAFPLYAWCLVVGSVKTKNIFKYGLRLLGLALISQPLYMMALSHDWTDFNILFTLLIGLTAIGGIRAKWYGSHIWVPLLCFTLLGFVRVDYGWQGVMFMLVLYGARKTRSGLIAAYIAYALFWGSNSSSIMRLFGVNLSILSSSAGLGRVLASFFRMQGMVWLSLPLITLEFHSHFCLPKWLGYALYPLHLVLLILLRLGVNGVTWEQLLMGF